jgi:glyoxylase-like metal-dependent hydrolase (beta-lactamase superfamily II)
MDADLGLIIEHPEGVFVMTPRKADVNNPAILNLQAYLLIGLIPPSSNLTVEKNEEIGPQLDQLKIPIENIKAVVLTHLHLDHIDGLNIFSLHTDHC